LDALQCYNIQTSLSNHSAISHSDIVVLATKPDVTAYICEENASALYKKTIVSLAAKNTISDLEALARTPVSRVMTGLFVREEIAWYTMSPQANDCDEDIVRYIFREVARPVQEPLLAVRMALAVFTGIDAKFMDVVLKVCQDPAVLEVLVASKHAIANAANRGVSPANIVQSVGGPKSYTAKTIDALEREGVFALIAQYLKKLF
jgi:pyrroline-5-carboxylate reductase